MRPFAFFLLRVRYASNVMASCHLNHSPTSGKPTLTSYSSREGRGSGLSELGVKLWASPGRVKAATSLDGAPVRPEVTSPNQELGAHANIHACSNQPRNQFGIDFFRRPFGSSKTTPPSSLLELKKCPIVVPARSRTAHSLIRSNSPGTCTGFFSSVDDIEGHPAR